MRNSKMDSISLEKGKQNELNDRVKSIKKGIKSKKILINENGSKRARINSIRKKKIKRPNATIYLGHIPHGFYENEMMAYFSQFGKVLSATVVRSKKTGRSRGFGFVEFQNEEVAQIAAETMNNYLMYNRLLTCKYIPPEERRLKHSKIDPKNYPRKINRLKDLRRKNSSANKLENAAYQQKVQNKIKKFEKFFKEKGIDFLIKMPGSQNISDANDWKDASNESADESNDAANESDGHLGVLEIDESDNDIQFTTPPNVKKIIKKSCDSTMLKKQKKKVIVEKLSNVVHKKEKNIKRNNVKLGTASKEPSNQLLKKKAKESIFKAIKMKKLDKGSAKHLIREISESMELFKKKKLRNTSKKSKFGKVDDENKLEVATDPKLKKISKMKMSAKIKGMQKISKKR